MKDLVEAAATPVAPPTPPPPVEEDEIPTAMLLEEPSGTGSPAPPGGPKPVFTFDKEELRKRRDEKIRRIIKGF